MTATSSDRREYLERAVRGKQCLRCAKPPVVAWLDGDWAIRCGCYPQEPKLTAQPDALGEKWGNMVRQNLPAIREDENPNQALVTSTTPQPLTIEQFQQRLGLIKHVVGQMEDKVHYGVIPGTRDRSLWEPGAEYLRAAFNIAWDYEMLEEREDFDGGEYYYKVRAFAVSADGRPIAGWTASAWSKETKFNGMSKFDLPHNVRDRAIKRAFVAMIRNVTGTTGYFKQALDLEAENERSQQRRPERTQGPTSGQTRAASQSADPKAEDDSTRFFREAQAMGYDPKAALGMLNVTSLGDFLKNGRTVNDAIEALKAYGK